MRNRVLALVAIGLIVCSSPLLAADHAAWLAKVEGFFATQRATTPLGAIPFAMDMVKEADGSVHGRTWADKQTYFDFKFYLDEKGELLFHETGALPGGLVQSHILEVAKIEGDTITFESKKAPGLLVATVTADGKQLHVVSVVRGKPHADLQMPRVTAPQALAFFRESNAKNREQGSSPIVQQTVQTAIQASLGQAVGTYELSGTGRILTITLEDGKLFGQPNAGDKREIKAEADGLFVPEGSPFKMRFIRDEKGAVTHLQMLVNGEEIQRGTKVK
jgi:hypothetical protein